MTQAFDTSPAIFADRVKHLNLFDRPVEHLPDRTPGICATQASQVIEGQATPRSPQNREPGDPVCRVMQSANQAKDVLDHGTDRQRIDILRLIADPCLFQSVNDRHQVIARTDQNRNRTPFL